MDNQIVLQESFDQRSTVAVILTFNEENNIETCLDQFPADFRVIVIDSGSSDNTIVLAAERGATVLERTWTGFADQRNFALEALAGDAQWILFVDTDEIYPPEFFLWLRKAVQSEPPVDVFQVPSILYLNGKRLNHAPGYPIYHPRLVRVGVTRFEKNHAGHGERALAERTEVINIGYRHYFQSGSLSPWLQKHIGLALMEADGEQERAVTARSRLSGLAGRGLARVPLRFLYHYVIRQGFRDGRMGLTYSVMYSWYELTIWLLRRR